MVCWSIGRPEAILRLWRLLGILVLTTTIFFAFLAGITAAPADLTFFLTVLLALATPPTLMLACLHTGRLRLAVYCSIPDMLTSVGICVAVLAAFLAPYADTAGILWYPIGIAFALPCGYASVLQLRVGATIAAGPRTRRAALGRSGAMGHLTP